MRYIMNLNLQGLAYGTFVPAMVIGCVVDVRL
jgi:hypothetical protein